jgi:hypothetical protein
MLSSPPRILVEPQRPRIRVKAIAKLGEEGWEMVGQGPLEIRQGGLNAINFKRPKP